MFTTHGDHRDLLPGWTVFPPGNPPLRRVVSREFDPLSHGYYFLEFLVCGHIHRVSTRIRATKSRRCINCWRQKPQDFDPNKD